MIYGLRFYRASVKVERGIGAPIFIHGRLEENRSDFDFIFSCLYSELQHHVFVENINGPFACHDDESWSHALETLQREPHIGDENKIGLMPARVLEKFGPYVSDDWNGALLFQSGALSLIQMLALTDDLLWRDKREAFSQCEAAQVVFHNWDGVYWEIFCKDNRLIEQLLQTHRDNAALSIYKVDFALDYPDPRKVQLEKA